MKKFSEFINEAIWKQTSLSKKEAGDKFGLENIRINGKDKRGKDIIEVSDSSFTKGKKWKQTSLSKKEAGDKYGSDNVRVIGTNRDGSDTIEILD